MSIQALTTEQMKEVDRLMIEDFGISLVQMMENAGRNLAELARRILGRSLDGANIAVLCGTGNNGGGGMVAARHLQNWGAKVWVQLAGEESRLKEVPSAQWRILARMGEPGADQHAPAMETPDLVLDAILGYGVQGNPRGNAARWIAWANSLACPVISLDAPSGLDTTSGVPGDPCVRASATLTLALPKTGLESPEARSFVGDLYLADISVPPMLYRQLGLEVGSIFNADTIVRIW